jgi:hypothetical protein
MYLVWFAGVVDSFGENAKKMDVSMSSKTCGAAVTVYPEVGTESNGSPGAAKLKKRRVVPGPRTPEVQCRRVLS